MKLELTGKSVLITGASRGIGKAAALGFAAEGCHLHLVARSEEALTALAQEIRAAHAVEVTIHPFDLTAEGAIDTVVARCGNVDVLVNNAGAMPPGPIEQLSDADWRRGFDLKIHATVALTREFYIKMKERRDGVIVNVIGNCGERHDSEIIIATIANTGLMGFTRALGSVSPDHNVRVVGVNPGPTATERLVFLMQEKAEARTGDRDRWSELVAPLPFGRAARPDELADMIVFAASARASFVSGTILTVDGGVAHRSHLF